MRFRVVGVAVAVLMVNGCGSGSQGSAPTRSPVEPGDQLGTIRTDWWFGEQPVGSELEIIAYTGSSECVRFDRVDVEESSQVVTIYAYVDRFAETNCTDDYTIRAEDVRLSEPLGDRAVVGCIAPGSGLRASDLDHPGPDTDCTTRLRPDVTVP